MSAYDRAFRKLLLYHLVFWLVFFGVAAVVWITFGLPVWAPR